MKFLIILSFLCAFFVQGNTLRNTENNAACQFFNYGCSTCFKDKNNEVLCNSCLSGYKLENDSCEYDSSQCTRTSSKSCNIPYCSQQQAESICLKCVFGYSWKSESNKCQYLCTNYFLEYNDYWGSFYDRFESIYIDSSSTCNRDCKSAANCDKCQNQNQNTCFKCLSGYFLYKETCVSSCPDFTYANERNSCVACPPQCKQCTSETVCLSCNENEGQLSSIPNCQCPAGQFFFQKKCLNSCPYNSQTVGKNCIRLCSDNYYPIFSSSTEYSCSYVNDWISGICFYVIPEIPNLISFSFGGIDASNYFHLNVQIIEVHYVCFAFYIRGIDQSTHLAYNYGSSVGNGIVVDLWFQKNVFLDGNQVICSLTECQLSLEIFWGGQIQYKYAVLVSQSLNIILKSTLTYTGNAQQYDIVCEKCPIPQEKTISSTLIINCQTGQTCDGSTLTTASGSTISVTQKIDDPALLNNTLMPHSLRFSGAFQGYNLYVYITKYSFQNNVPGQITFTFSAVGVQTGTIEIISFIKNASVNLRILASSSALPVYYPSQSLKLKIDDTKQSEPEGSNAALYGGIAGGVCFIVLVSIFTIYYFKKLRKRASVGIETKKVQKDEQKQVFSEKKDEVSQVTYQNVSEIQQPKEKSPYMGVAVSFDALNK